MTQFEKNIAQLDRFELGYRPALDGIRGYSVLLVMAYHWFIHQGVFPGGFVGVDMFFVLSGFLITSLLITEVRKTGTIQLGKFYMRRALRLLPIAWLYVGIIWVFFATIEPTLAVDLKPGWAWKINSDGVLATLFYYNNLAQAAGTGGGNLQHYWSLSLEEQFYLFWPFFLLFALRRISVRALISITGLTIVAISVWRAYLYHAGTGVWALNVRPDTRMDGVLWGCLVSILVHRGTIRIGDAPRRALSTVLVVFGIVVVAYASMTLSHSVARAWYGGLSLVAVANVSILLGVLMGPSVVHGLFDNRLMAYLGKISYSLYIFHFPICFALTTYYPWTSVPAFLAFLSLSIAVSTLLYFTVERFFLGMKKRYAALEH